MVTKNKAEGKKGKIKVGNLKLKKETVKNLTPQESKKIKGGASDHPLCAEDTRTCIRPR
jgi:hypothetical protein